MSTPPTGATTRSGPRYVVTLLTSSMPMQIKLPAGVAFPGLSVFRSRTVEDGRERFRLHIGYFASLPEAEQALAAVRAHYPSALISALPASDSGSLDDTINTDFSLVRGAVARLVDGEPVAPAAAPRTEPASPTLTPGEVASVMAPQRYAVQLDWALRPIDAAAIPRLGIFRAYSLYAVRVLRHGSPEYGLRLGFFKNLDGARQVADYVRHAYARASVVPVSYREYARASELNRPEPAAAPPPPTAAAAPAGTDVAAAEPPAGEPRAPAPARTRAEMLSLLGAHELEVDRDSRVTLTAEERELLLRRPQRTLRNW